MPLMDPDYVTLFRYTYAILAGVVCVIFVRVVVSRKSMHPALKVVCWGLVVQHATITYAAYTALDQNFPPTAIGLLLTVSLTIILVGFMLWAVDSSLKRSRAAG